MMKKRIVTRTLAVMSAVAVLVTGCGVKEGDSGRLNNEESKVSESSVDKAKDESESVSEEGKDDSTESVKITWYVVGAPQSGLDKVLEEANKIIEEEINATLDLVFFDWGEYDQKMSMLITAQEDWDLCFTSSWLNDYVSYSLKGAFLELDDYLDKYASAYMEQIPEQFRDATKINGKMYGFVNYQNEYICRTFKAQQEVLDKYGLQDQFLEVDDWESLEPILEVLKEKEPTKIPLFHKAEKLPELFTVSGDYDIDFVQSNSSNPLAININDKDMKVFNALESDKVMEMAKLFRSWYEKGYIRKDQISRKDHSVEWGSGQYIIIDDAVEAEFNNELDVTKSPAEPNTGLKVIRKAYVPSYVSTGSVLAALTAVNKNSKNPEKAVMLYNLMLENKELYNLICNGISGVNYTEEANGQITPIMDAGYAPGLNWVFGNTFNAPELSNQKPGYLNYVKDQNDKALKSPLLGFNYSPEAVQQEYTLINDILAEYLPPILTGTVDPEKAIPDINKKLAQAGMDTIIEDAQKQIDEWRKTVGK